MRPTGYATDPETSARMSRVGSSGTCPEVLVRGLLHAMGIGYRSNRTSLPGRPDIVVASRSVAIFVHGCFWHRHTCRRGQSMPVRNAPLWAEKLTRNVSRDRANARALRRDGWRVMTIWECQVRSERTVARLESVLGVAR